MQLENTTDTFPHLEASADYHGVVLKGAFESDPWTNEVVEQYAIWLSRQSVSPHTAKVYIGRIKWFARLAVAQDVRLSGPCDETLRLMHFYLQSAETNESLSVHTKNSIKLVFNSFLVFQGRRAAFRKDRAESPAGACLNREELEELLKLVFSSSTSGRDRALCLTMLFCGLRLGECIQLREEDIVFNARPSRIVVLRESGARQIPLCPSLQIEFAKLMREMDGVEPSGKPLFQTSTQRSVSYPLVSYLIKHLGFRARLDITPSVLRNTFIEILRANSIDHKLIGQLAGISRSKLSQIENIQLVNPAQCDLVWLLSHLRAPV